MSKPKMSKRKAHAISIGIFLISLAILILTKAWWPGILLAIWATVASRQYLTGRIYYAIVSTLVLGGLFFFTTSKYNADFYIPVILLVAGIFLIVKEYYFTRDTNGEETSEEIKEDAELNE